MTKISMITAILALILAAPVAANIDVKFDEGAPKDRFTFTNTGACAVGPATLVLDLSESVAGLIFDTTGEGAGVEVFQPFETVAGADALGAVSPVTDGDNRIELSVTALAPGASIAFTIDVDDTARHSALGQIQVTDAEIAGASVVLTAGAETSLGVFDNTSRAVVRVGGCSS